MLTKEEFEALSPRQRGYVVYMYGDRDDQPNVPSESCPYPPGSVEWEQYAQGMMTAVLEVQDMED